jgi:hypothetical protein
LYSFYDATIYDDILDFVKTELVDAITVGGVMQQPHAVQNNFNKAVACISKNDASHENVSTHTIPSTAMEV